MKPVRLAWAMAFLGPLAAPAAAQDGTAAGRAAYERHCAECHAAPREIGGRATRLEEAGRRSALERFLGRHHAPDAQARAAIVAWLAEVTR